MGPCENKNNRSTNYKEPSTHFDVIDEGLRLTGREGRVKVE